MAAPSWSCTKSPSASRVRAFTDRRASGRRPGGPGLDEFGRGRAWSGARWARPRSGRRYGRGRRLQQQGRRPIPAPALTGTAAAKAGTPRSGRGGSGGPVQLHQARTACSVACSNCLPIASRSRSATEMASRGANIFGRTCTFLPFGVFRGTMSDNRVPVGRTSWTHRRDHRRNGDLNEHVHRPIRRRSGSDE